MVDHHGMHVAQLNEALERQDPNAVGMSFGVSVLLLLRYV